MIIRKTGYLFIPALLATWVPYLGAQQVDDPLTLLQRRSNEVYEKASPSVVGIRVRVHLPFTAQVSPDGKIEWYFKTGPFRLKGASEPILPTNFDPSESSPQTGVPGGLSRPRRWVDRYGTGFLFDREGHVLTTYQLVKDSTHGTEMTAISSTGLESPAHLIAADPYSNIAVIRSPELDGTPADFVDSDAVDFEPIREGTFVFCVARPYGLPNSAYFGMVSGLNRQVGQFRYERYIQTTVPLPPGSNGAPLLTMDGKVGGMMSCTLKQEGWTEVSFAVPAEMVMQVARELVQQGTVFRGYLGVRVVNPDQMARIEPADAAKYPPHSGAIVRDVLPETPAMKAGLLPGDLIVGVDDSRIEGWEDLVWALNSLKPGQTVTLRVFRGDRKLSLPVRLSGLAAEVQRLERRR